MSDFDPNFSPSDKEKHDHNNHPSNSPISDTNNVELEEKYLEGRELGIISKIRNIFCAIKPILTSHHPLCDQFKNHTFNISGREFCIGCFIGYPSGIIVLLVGYLFNIFQFMQTGLLWIIGFILISIYIASTFHSSDAKKIKIFSKVFMGSGVAFLIAAIFSYSWDLWIKFLTIFVVINIILGLLSFKRLKGIKKTCTNCEWKNNWRDCPGMQIIYHNLYKSKNDYK